MLLLQEIALAFSALEVGWFFVCDHFLKMFEGPQNESMILATKWQVSLGLFADIGCVIVSPKTRGGGGECFEV